MEIPPFEQLRTLAETNPANFEELRSELIADLIDNCPPKVQRRLRGLQFEIDARRRLAPTPMKALIEIQGMMHDSLRHLSDVMHTHPRELYRLLPERATVLTFPSTASRH